MGSVGEEGEVDRKIAEWGVPSAVRNRDTGIEVCAIVSDGFFSRGVACPRVVMRTVGLQVVGRKAKIAVREAQGREDVLLHVGFPRVAAQLLDDPRQIDESGVGIAET